MNSKTRNRIIGIASVLALGTGAAVLTTKSNSPKYNKVPPGKQGDGGLILGKRNADGTVSTDGIQPGDTIYLSAKDNPRTYVYLGPGISGREGDTVVVWCDPATVVSGFQIEGKFVKLVGNGAKVVGPGGSAFAIREKASDIIVEGFNSSNVDFHFWIKNEASCDTSMNNHVINNIIIRNNVCKDSRYQGMYAGSTNVNDGNRSISCSGKIIEVRPSYLGNIQIYNNEFDGCGRSAIQLSNARVGMSYIYNNKVRNTGREGNESQASGITLGIFTKAKVFDNDISNTGAWSLTAFGASYVDFQRNRVDSSGWLDGKHTAWAWAIAVDNRPQPGQDSTTFIIKDNITGVYGSGQKEPIYVGKTLAEWYSKAGNLVCSNKDKNGKSARVTVEAGISYSDMCIEQAPPPVQVPGNDSAVSEFIVMLMKDGTIKWKKK